MAAAARLTARAIGPLVRRWRAFWDVDHVAPRFYTPAEFEAVEEARQEAWDAAVKRMAVRHVKTQVLPRVNVDLSQGLTSAAVTVRPRAAPLSGDLYEKCVCRALACWWWTVAGVLGAGCCLRCWWPT